MALVFSDSFDHYATADIEKKWTSKVSVPSIVSSGRNGTDALRLVSAPLSVSKTVPAQSFHVFGGAYEASGMPTTRDELISFKDNGTTQVSVAITAAGILEVYRGTVSGTLLGTGTAVLNLDAYNYIEVKLTINSSSGAVEVRVNEVTDIILSSQNTQTTGNASANQLQLDAGGGGFWDDVIMLDNTGGVNDDFLGDVRVEAVLPDGAGSSAQWTPSAGSNFENVDDNPPDGDTTYNSETTATDKDLYTMGDLVTTAGAVQALAVHALARKDDGGSRSIATIVKEGATETDGATNSIGDNYLYLSDNYDTNPDTASAWTILEVNGIEAGIKLIS